MRRRWYIELALKAVLFLSGIALAVRAIAGPFHFGVSIGSPMKAEGLFGVAVLLLLICRATDRLQTRYPLIDSTCFMAAVGLMAAGFAAYSGSFVFPFLADDYVHIPNALYASQAYLGALFTQPGSDRFFRPVTFLSYAIEARAAGYEPVAWHALSVLLHIMVSLLVYTLARRRGFAVWTAIAAAMLFLLHGSRPEAVTWIGAQFDLWAAFFVLIALLAFDRGWHAASLAPLLLALLSKESAYIYPLLLLLLLRLDRVPFNRWPRLTGPSFLLTSAAFLYRWRVIGGIGGYRDSVTNRAVILSLDLIHTGQGFTTRLAAALNFPINWSHPPEGWLIALLVAAIAAWACLAAGAADRRKLWFGFGFLMLAAIPVHQFLLIDATLEKSRVLYLPSVGFALIFAAALEAARPRVAIGAACAILAFQTAALEHNLLIWHRISALAASTCASVAAFPGEAEVSDTPNELDGVYFLHTGLRGCIERAGGLRPDLHLAGDPVVLEPPAPALIWDGVARRFEVREAGAGQAQPVPRRPGTTSP
jgi:hypothetical protein